MQNKQYWVYIITNHTNTVLYTGMTNNIKRRLFEHKSKLSGSSFSNKYNLYKLIWFQEFQTPRDAIAIEKKIKGWRRSKKLELIEQSNPNYVDLMQK